MLYGTYALFVCHNRIRARYKTQCSQNDPNLTPPPSVFKLHPPITQRFTCSTYFDMPPGHGSGLHEDFQKWIDARKPQYLGKTGVGKAVPGQPLPSDDSDLQEWVLKCRSEFETEFTDRITVEADTTPGFLNSLQKQFDAYFRNYKAKETTKFYKTKVMTTQASTMSGSSASTPVASSAPSTSTPFFLLEGNEVTPWTLFDAHMQPEVSIDISTQRKLGAIPHQRHARIVNHELKLQWDSLNVADKSEWEAKALEYNNTQDVDCIYWNQKIFLPEIIRVLQELISKGKPQTGNSAFCLMYTYQDESESLQSGQVTVCNNGDEFNSSKMSLLWRDFCKTHVNYNHPEVYNIDQEISSALPVPVPTSDTAIPDSSPGRSAQAPASLTNLPGPSLLPAPPIVGDLEPLSGESAQVAPALPAASSPLTTLASPLPPSTVSSAVAPVTGTIVPSPADAPHTVPSSSANLYGPPSPPAIGNVEHSCDESTTRMAPPLVTSSPSKGAPDLNSDTGGWLVSPAIEAEILFWRSHILAI
ncbi:hypothetical protein Hypma_014616 [Hypsizygus marmoreus]|uniref:Uncharacterized protein n=1 Tax=Hypsizygus marmoreus TaxID=39966 RepID=A0A369JDU2_HYPMA|nr:hypothetical protein Hypma_014616 [Hypsizygus marmoreus]